MWIALLIILSILLGIFLYVLFAPVVLEIDTILGLYRVRFHWLAWGRIYFIGLEPWVEIKVAWWHKQFSLLELPKSRQKKEEKSVAKNIKKKKKFTMKWATIKALFRSFKVEKFSWHLDTGDYALNGMLYPLFWWYGYKSGHNVAINFVANNSLVLTIKNTGWRVIKAFLTKK